MPEISNLDSVNIWDYKPRWCQPWSIMATGIALITAVWWLTKIIWLTLIFSTLIMIWWGYFLVIYPRLFKQYIENQMTQKKMTIS